MKHFSICLFMLLLLMLGKYNRARLQPGPTLSQQPNPSVEALQSRIPGGSVPHLAGLVAQ